jgi:hypothetical protein
MGQTGISKNTVGNYSQLKEYNKELSIRLAVQMELIALSNNIFLSW